MSVFCSRPSRICCLCCSQEYPHDKGSLQYLYSLCIHLLEQSKLRLYKSPADLFVRNGQFAHFAFRSSIARKCSFHASSIKASVILLSRAFTNSPLQFAMFYQDWLKPVMPFLPSVNGTTTFSILCSLCFTDIFKNRQCMLSSILFVCADNLQSLLHIISLQACCSLSFSNSSVVIEVSIRRFTIAPSLKPS